MHVGGREELGGGGGERGKHSKPDRLHTHNTLWLLLDREEGRLEGLTTGAGLVPPASLRARD